MTETAREAAVESLLWGIKSQQNIVYTNEIHVLLSNFNNKLLNKHKVIMPRVAKDTVFTV